MEKLGRYGPGKRRRASFILRVKFSGSLRKSKWYTASLVRQDGKNKNETTTLKYKVIEKKSFRITSLS